MDEVSPKKDPPTIWPSVDDAKPAEEGGPLARIGFNYQDEIAAGFLITMLETPALLKVHCETHDDIVLVYQGDSASERVAEFVQVKASEQEKLWSVADLCQRKKGKDGTSVFEISLSRDRHRELSRFRLVTLRPVVHALEPLTHPIDAPCRDLDTEGMQVLCADLDERFPEIASPKGNKPRYWLQNCCWDQRHDEDAARKQNLVRLLRLGAKESRNLLVEPAESLLDELRGKAKAAAGAKWEPDPFKKILFREQLRGWWEQRTTDLEAGAASISGGKLANKMNDAELPYEVIDLAVDLRRIYAAASRSPRYLEPEETERLKRRVKSDVMTLQSRRAAGQLNIDGPGFHALCVDRMDAINAERNPMTEDQSAFLKGCMYDIADRCLLRFRLRTK
jgi:hypothetical protein